jgi:hypothetical protein
LRHDSSYQTLEFSVVSGRWQRGVSHVILEIEVRVVHPNGPPRAKGNRGQLLAKARDELQPRADDVEHLVVVGRWALENGYPTDVHVGVGAFQMEEELVEDLKALESGHTDNDRSS